MILLRFCLILVAVNALTIGGGFVMLPMLQREFVERYQWLTNQEFLDAIAIGQVTPGPLTVMNAFIGYKISGLCGAVLAMVSSYLPCTLIVMLVAKYYYRYKNSRLIAASFAGIKAAVVGLLAAAAISLGNTSLVDVTTVGIALVSFAIITFTEIDPMLILLGGGMLGVLVY